MFLVRDGSPWWREISHDDGSVAPAANLIVVKAQPVLPKMVQGPGVNPTTQGDAVEQGQRIVVIDVDIAAHPSLATILKLESREDPNLTQVRRTIKQVLCPANVTTTFRMHHTVGIALPAREGVPAADACADLVLGCYDSSGALANFSTQFAAASQSSLSLTASGVTVGARNKRGWDGFNG